jgi:hypothetical protein
VSIGEEERVIGGGGREDRGKVENVEGRREGRKRELL